MKHRLAAQAATVLVTITILAVAGVGSPAAATPSTDLGLECETSLAALPGFVSGPGVAGWPHHDPLLDAMVPDVIDGVAQWHLLVTGADPDDPSRADHQLARAAGRDPAGYRSVQALPDGQPQSVSAVRVSGATSRQTLDALLTLQIFHPFEDEALEATCTATEVDGQPAIMVTNWDEEALLMPFEDAWLTVTADAERLAFLEPELRAHLVRLAKTGIEPVAATAPEAGTRVAPPAAAAKLAASLPPAIDGVPIEYLGAASGQLGLGMVPIRLASLFDPLTRAAADELGVDLSTTWGEAGTIGDGGVVDAMRVSIWVLIDPAGDAQRWIQPLLDVRLDPDTWLPDPAAPRFIPTGTFRQDTVAGKDLWVGGKGDGDRSYLYADGPYLFRINVDSPDTGRKVLSALP